MKDLPKTATPWKSLFSNWLKEIENAGSRSLREQTELYFVEGGGFHLPMIPLCGQMIEQKKLSMKHVDIRGIKLSWTIMSSLAKGLKAQNQLEVLRIIKCTYRLEKQHTVEDRSTSSPPFGAFFALMLSLRVFEKSKLGDFIFDAVKFNNKADAKMIYCICRALLQCPSDRFSNIQFGCKTSQTDEMRIARVVLEFLDYTWELGTLHEKVKGKLREVLSDKQHMR